MSQITNLTSIAQLDSFLKTDKLVIIDFHATWCGPCKTIAPLYEQLSTLHKTSRFAKCDVDAVQAIAQKYGVTAMPTFCFIKKGIVVETLKGANPSALKAAILKHSSSSSSEGDFPGVGNSLAGNAVKGGGGGGGGGGERPWYVENGKVLLFGLVVVGLFFYSRD